MPERVLAAFYGEGVPVGTHPLRQEKRQGDLSFLLKTPKVATEDASIVGDHIVDHHTLMQLWRVDSCPLPHREGQFGTNADLPPITGVGGIIDVDLDPAHCRNGRRGKINPPDCSVIQRDYIANRSFDIGDIYADSIGCIIALVVSIKKNWFR